MWIVGGRLSIASLVEGYIEINFTRAPLSLERAEGMKNNAASYVRFHRENQSLYVAEI